MIRRPPSSTRTYTLFPYTTLFRSELGLIWREIPGDILRQPCGRRRTHGFMRFLRVLRLGLVEPRLWRQRLGAELLRDHLADFGQRVLLRIDRDGKNVGSQARSEERSEGKDCVRTCRFRWSPYPKK